MPAADPPTTQILVRKLELDVRDRLRERARDHGVSMEEEARRILRAAILTPDTSPAASDPNAGWATRIAGIVQARRGTLATRNVKHFTDTGIRVVDPWAEV